MEVLISRIVVDEMLEMSAFKTRFNEIAADEGIKIGIRLQFYPCRKNECEDQNCA